MGSGVVELLVRELPAGMVRISADLTAAYAGDESGLPGGLPAAVVTPRTVEHVRVALRCAAVHQTPVVPRGAGTGLSGGACAVDGCVVLDMTRMAAILELDPAARLAVVQPGVVTAAVSAAAAPHALMYAPDPSSWQSSTIGGNIATNAGGLRCLRYGVTRTSVLGLLVVLADGRVLRTGGRAVKRSAGYDLTQLFIGSEGTLGVVVEATLRLQPLPPPQLTGLLTFANVVDAAAAASHLAGTTSPTLCELMDAGVVAALDAQRGAGFGAAVGAVLLVQVDATPAAQRAVESAAAACGATELAVADGPAEAEALLDLRRAAFPALQQLGPLVVEDVCVPVPRLGEMLAAVPRLAQASGVQACSAAHAGDGNLHPVLVAPDGSQAAAWAAADAVFRTALSLGGTVSGEHGVGRLKRRWLREELSQTSLDVQASLKQTLDPLGILNPGAVLET